MIGSGNAKYIVEKVIEEDGNRYFRIVDTMPGCLSFKGGDLGHDWPGLPDNEEFRYVAKQDGPDLMEIGWGVYDRERGRVERIRSEYNSDGLDPICMKFKKDMEVVLIMVPKTNERRPMNPKEML